MKEEKRTKKRRRTGGVRRIRRKHTEKGERKENYESVKPRLKEDLNDKERGGTAEEIKVNHTTEKNNWETAGRGIWSLESPDELVPCHKFPGTFCAVSAFDRSWDGPRLRQQSSNQHWSLPWPCGLVRLQVPTAEDLAVLSKNSDRGSNIHSLIHGLELRSPAFQFGRGPSNRRGNCCTSTAHSRQLWSITQFRNIDIAIRTKNMQSTVRKGGMTIFDDDCNDRLSWKPFSTTFTVLARSIQFALLNSAQNCRNLVEAGSHMSGILKSYLGNTAHWSIRCKVMQRGLEDLKACKEL